MSSANDETTPCAACGETENEAGLYVWVLSGTELEPYCAGTCINGFIAELRAAGLEEGARVLEESIARQLAGGWKDNVRLLEQTQPPGSQQDYSSGKD